MISSEQRKKEIQDLICERLSAEQEIQKIVLFGSFIHSDNPNDVDIAVFQSSNKKYLSLAMKYRKLVRDIARILPVDIFPIAVDRKGAFLREIEAGRVIYER